MKRGQQLTFCSIAFILKAVNNLRVLKGKTELCLPLKKQHTTLQQGLLGDWCRCHLRSVGISCMLFDLFLKNCINQYKKNALMKNVKVGWTPPSLDFGSWPLAHSASSYAVKQRDQNLSWYGWGGPVQRVLPCWYASPFPLPSITWQLYLAVLSPLVILDAPLAFFPTNWNPSTGPTLKGHFKDTFGDFFSQRACAFKFFYWRLTLNCSWKYGVITSDVCVLMWDQVLPQWIISGRFWCAVSPSAGSMRD